ncbi:MAG: DUF1540 domain-containing protein [Clostridiales bacterium]|nr:DUF1540 domain-containing protein [Clostridiales bacterium]MDR2712090.1 DUF1540 domain-containing protein [Clostridiales bacterium]
MNTVSCRVEECVYNDNNLCKAKSIEVRSSGTLSVHSPDNTACGTFRDH